MDGEKTTIIPVNAYGGESTRFPLLREANLGSRVVNYAKEFAYGNVSDVCFITNTEAKNLVTRNAQQDQTIKALQEQLSKLTAQSQRPTQEYGMQTNSRPLLWSHKDQLLLNQLTDGQDNINWDAVQQQFPGRTVHQLKSHYKNQQRKDQLVLQQQQIQALQQQAGQITGAQAFGGKQVGEYYKFNSNITNGIKNEMYQFVQDQGFKKIAQQWYGVNGTSGQANAVGELLASSDKFKQYFQ